MNFLFNFGFGLTQYVPHIIYFLWWIIVAISLVKTEIGILFLIPILPFQNLMDKLQRFPCGKDLVDILIIAIIIGWFLRTIARREKFLESTPFNLPLFTLVILTYIGLWAGSSYLGGGMPVDFSDPRIMNWKNYMIIFLTYFMVINNIKNKKWIITLLMLMGLSILIMNRWFFSTYQWVKSEHFTYKQRFSLGYVGPNVLSAFFGHNIFVLLGLAYFDKSRLRRIFFIVISLISLYSVFYSFSRSIYLAVFIGFILLALLKDKKLFIPILILLLFWKSILPASVVERITMTVQEDIYGKSISLDESTAQRIDIWQKSTELFRSSPILGVGFQVIPFLGFDELRDTHNMYITFLAEMGIIGLGLFLFLFYLALRSSWKLYKKANDSLSKGLGLGVFVSTIVCMVSNFFGDHWTYIQLGTFYWTFLAIVVRANFTEESRIVKKFIENANYNITSNK